MVLTAIFAQQISIHAPRTGSDASTVIFLRQKMAISIHAPRTGSDHATRNRQGTGFISIHAPRTGSDVEEGVRQIRAM